MHSSESWQENYKPVKKNKYWFWFDSGTIDSWGVEIILKKFDYLKKTVCNWHHL